MRPLYELLPEPLLGGSPAAAPAGEADVLTAPRRSPMSPRERLVPVLRAAAGLDLDDPEAAVRVRDAATAVTAALAAEGALPAALVVAPHDPPGVVVRTVAAAWRRLTPVSPR